MSKYDVDIHGCTGLFAGNRYGWQGGLRRTLAMASKIIGKPATMHTPMNGYSGWQKVVDSAIRRQADHLWFIVHSNGGKFATYAAEALAPHGVECSIVMFDRTLGHCADLGANVRAALDMHVNKSWLKLGPDFSGRHRVIDYGGETSHIGVIDYLPARVEALTFIEGEEGRWPKR